MKSIIKQAATVIFTIIIIISIISYSYIYIIKDTINLLVFDNTITLIPITIILVLLILYFLNKKEMREIKEHSNFKTFPYYYFTAVGLVTFIISFISYAVVFSYETSINEKKFVVNTMNNIKANLNIYTNFDPKQAASEERKSLLIINELLNIKKSLSSLEDIIEINTKISENLVNVDLNNSTQNDKIIYINIKDRIISEIINPEDSYKRILWNLDEIDEIKIDNLDLDLSNDIRIKSLIEENEKLKKNLTKELFNKVIAKEESSKKIFESLKKN